jgi:hypothetical protein
MGKVARATLLADPVRAPLAIQQSDGRASVRLPEARPAADPPVLCLEMA